MADEQKQSLPGWALPVGAAGAIGLLIVGQQQSARNDADNISNLPAIEARVNQLEEDLGQTLSRSELDSRLNTIDETIIRRFQEDAAVPLSRVREDVEKNEDKLEDHAERISQLEAKAGN